jgi:nucleoside-diphosphate-sugar epimerase
MINQVFSAGVDRVIFASSVMLVFGYYKREPYLSIFNETFDDKTMLKSLRKLTVNDDPTDPSDRSKGHYIYSKSKIIGEEMAKDIVKNSTKSIISVRVGWVNIDNQPGITCHRTVWFSYRDVCSFFEKAIQAPSHISGTYFATSNNHRSWLDLDDAKRDLGYVPQDGAEPLE